jgi:hypothetical protein
MNTRHTKQLIKVINNRVNTLLRVYQLQVKDKQQIMHTINSLLEYQIQLERSK